MITTVWLLLAAAALMWVGPSLALERTDRLTLATRLAPRTDPRVRRPNWSAVIRGLPLFGPIGVVALLLTAGAAAAVAATAVFGCGAILGRDILSARRAREQAGDLLVGIEVIVGELEAGAQPGPALLAAAASAPRHEQTLRAAGHAALDGTGAATALLADPHTAGLGTAWRVGDDGGIALAVVLRRVVADLRAAVDQRRTVQVALAGPRSSAVLLTGLPLLGIGLGLAMGAQPFAFLLASPSGRSVGCAGVLLDVAGVLWMRRILRRASRS